jgi:hypothetical protein
MAGTYSVTVTANGCTSGVGTTVVVVNTMPATPTASSNTPVCAGNTINLSTPAVAGATYSWTGPNSFSSAVQNPTRTNATIAMAGTYSVTVTTNGCVSAVGTTAVIVNTTPATPTPASNSPVCAGNTINLSTSAVAGATYSWTGPNSFSSAVQNPTITNAAVAMAGTYSVTVTTNGCTSAAGTTAVVVNTTPATPAPSSNSPVCAGNTINLSTPAVAGATYSWTGPNSFSSAVQNPTRTNATIAMAGTYSVTVTTNGCVSAVGTTAVVMNNPTTGTDVKTACDSYKWIDGVTYTTSNNTATHTLQNAAGCDSLVTLNLTIKHSSTATDVKTACDSYKWIDGVTYTTSNNTATHTLQNAAGCDSLITLNLTINTVDVSVSLIGNVLTAGASGAVYQWIDCNNGNIALPMETGQTYTAVANGNYAVIVTQNNCTDTSNCTNVIITNIASELNNAFINVYPNPSNGNVVVELSNIAHITVYNLLGKVILDEEMSKGTNQLNLSEQLNGVYYIKAVVDNRQQVFRIVITRL